MKKKLKNKTKEFSIRAIFGSIVFVFVVGVIFFLVGQSIWQTKQFIDKKIESEENEHIVKIQEKLFEMDDEMIFFEKTLNEIGEVNLITKEESGEINKNIRSLSGRLSDIERYYLDRRFDFSLEFFGKNSMTKDQKFEQLKKLTRDGELFLENMNVILLSSNLDQKNIELVEYNFRIFVDNYTKSLDEFNLSITRFPSARE